jgi:hypothetical protein
MGAARGAVDAATLAVALAPDANYGGYGRAVALAMRRLREASAYWQGTREPPPERKE